MKKRLTQTALVAATAALTLLTAVALADAHDGRWHFCGTAPNGLGVLANHHTSCAFARKVGRRAAMTAPKRLVVWSPVTRRFITMRRTGCGCSSLRPYVYRGGRDAGVKLLS